MHLSRVVVMTLQLEDSDVAVTPEPSGSSGLPTTIGSSGSSSCNGSSNNSNNNNGAAAVATAGDQIEALAILPAVEPERSNTGEANANVNGAAGMLPPPPPKSKVRAKVPLEKGYSQMVWLRLSQTEPDLAGPCFPCVVRMNVVVVLVVVVFLIGEHFGLNSVAKLYKRTWRPIAISNLITYLHIFLCPVLSVQLECMLMFFPFFRDWRTLWTQFLWLNPINLYGVQLAKPFWLCMIWVPSCLSLSFLMNSSLSCVSATGSTYRVQIF